MMVAKGKLIERKYIGSDFQEVCELPNLIGVQLDSYERFLQLDKLKAGAEPDPRYGLESVFRNAFPMPSALSSIADCTLTPEPPFLAKHFSQKRPSPSARTFTVFPSGSNST